jgi:hypothetical protein
VKQIDLDSSIYKPEVGIFEDNIRSTYFAIPREDYEWAGIQSPYHASFEVPVAVQVEHIRMYCQAIYNRYKSERYIRKVDTSGDIRAVVTALVRTLETDVFPEQTVILAYLQSAAQEQIRTITHRRMTFA